MTQMSKEYGTALFMLACELDKVNEYSSALDTVLDVFNKNPEYVTFLSSPGIPMQERVDAVENALGAFLPEHVVSFIKILCERGRINAFADCVKEYRKLLDAANKVSVAKVKSPVALTEDEKERLKSKLEKINGNSVVLDCSIDESLMGGIVVEIDGKIVDGSLRRRLHEVKEVMFK